MDSIQCNAVLTIKDTIRASPREKASPNITLGHLKTTAIVQKTLPVSSNQIKTNLPSPIIHSYLGDYVAHRISATFVSSMLKIFF